MKRLKTIELTRDDFLAGVYRAAENHKSKVEVKEMFSNIDFFIDDLFFSYEEDI